MNSSHYGIEAFRRKGPSWWRCGASKLSEGRGRCRAGGRPEGRGVRCRVSECCSVCRAILGWHEG